MPAPPASCRGRASLEGGDPLRLAQLCDRLQVAIEVRGQWPFSAPSERAADLRELEGLLEVGREALRCGGQGLLEARLEAGRGESKQADRLAALFSGMVEALQQFEQPGGSGSEACAKIIEWFGLQLQSAIYAQYCAVRGEQAPRSPETTP